jgi:hypothetical protein
MESAINMNDYDVEIVNEFPEEVEKILSERSAILKKALFSSPIEGILPEHYWSMERNKDEYIRRMRQYSEEMDKVIKAVAPIIATSIKSKFILTPKKRPTWQRITK